MQEQRKYYYPKYAPKSLMIKGLYIYEWVITAFVLVIPIISMQFTGVLLGLSFAGGAWFLFHRLAGARKNLLLTMIYSIRFLLSSRTVVKNERKDEWNDPQKAKE